MKAFLGIVLLGALLLVVPPSASATSSSSDGNCLDQSTLAVALRALLPDPGQTWAEKVRARCRYDCKCYYVVRRKPPCRRLVFLDCGGRTCSPCLGRAKLRARAKCKVRGAIRRCHCPFRRLRLKP